MKRGAVISIFRVLFLVLLLQGCQTDDVPLSTGGTFSYKGESYFIRQARYEWQGELYSGSPSVMRLTFSPSTLRVNESGISGYGAMVDLHLLFPSEPVELFGEYPVSGSFESYSVLSDSSRIVFYPEDKKDTVIIGVTGGYLKVDSVAVGSEFSIHLLTAGGDSLVGRYRGATVRNTIVPGDSVGYLLVDTVPYALQSGKLFHWGRLFDPDVYYYEFYLFSTDMRLSDAGAYRDGFYLVLGVQSDNGVRPSDGVYPVSRFFESESLLYGNRSGNMNWGSYWQTYAKGGVSGRGTILNDSITLSYQSDGTYLLDIALRDQMNNRVTGSYHAPLASYYYETAADKEENE